MIETVEELRGVMMIAVVSAGLAAYLYACDIPRPTKRITKAKVARQWIKRDAYAKARSYRPKQSKVFDSNTE